MRSKSSARYMRMGRNALATVAALSLTAGLVPTSALGAVIKYDLPKTPSSVTHTATDSSGAEYEFRHITTGATMYAEFNVEMLGIDDIESNPKTVVATWDAATSQSKAGILASNANICPNEHLSNYYYNIYAAENPSSGLIPTADSDSIFVTRSDSTDLTADHDNLPYTVYSGADILFATTEATMGKYVTAKNEGKQPGDDGYYDPIYCAAGTGTTAKMVDGEYRLANAADQVVLKNENAKGQYTVQSRYVSDASTYTIADDFAKVAYGTQYAVLKAIAEGKTTKKTVAVVSDYDSASQTYKLMNLDVNLSEIRGTGYAGHIAAGIQNTVNDLCDSLGAVDDGTEKYISGVTAEQLAKADYVLFSDYFSDTQYKNSQQLGKEEAVTLLKQAMGSDADGRVLANYPGLVFNFLYASSAESIFNYAIAQSFVYSDVLNFTDTMAYWYNKINHISTNNLQDMLDTLCANVSLPKGMKNIGTTSAAGIASLDAQLEEGMAYYEANKAKLIAAAPQLEKPTSTTFGVGRTKIDSVTYNGKAMTPSVEVYTISGDKVDASNYTVSYSDNTGVGLASATITGKEGTDFEGQSFTTHFLITEQISLANAKVTVGNGGTYTGNAITPAVTVALDGTTLKEGTDYSVAYKNNINAGTATVTVSGINEYTGTATATFTIDKATYNMSGVSFNNVSGTYTGESYTAAVSGTLPSGVTVSYIITPENGMGAYLGNSATEAGTYTVKANFSGNSNYNAISSKTATITIAQAANTMTAKAAKSTFKVNTSKAQTTKIKLTGNTGTVTFKSSKAGVTVNKSGKVTIKKGFKGTVKITVKDSGNNNYKAGSKTVTIKVK